MKSLKKLLLLLVITHHQIDFGMLTSRSSLKKLTNQQTILLSNKLPSSNIQKTHGPIIPTSIQKYQSMNLWDRVKNWFFTSITQPSSTFVKQTYDQTIESALNAIKQNRKSLPVAPPNMIICTQPGSVLLRLSKIDSFDDIKQACMKKRKEILRTIGLNNDEIETTIADIIKRKNDNIQNNHITTAQNTAVIHDPKLPFLATVKKTLQDSGINPETVHITTPSSATKLINSYGRKWNFDNKNKIIQIIAQLSPALAREISSLGIQASVNSTLKNQPILIFYYLGRHPNYLGEINFTIAHEIGHILENHIEEQELIETLCNNQAKKHLGHLNTSDYNKALKPYKKAYQDLEALHEIEADITAAMMNSEIATIAYQETSNTMIHPKARSILGGLIKLQPPKPSQPHSPIHASTETQVYLLQKIKDIHAREAVQKDTLSTKE